MTARDQTASTPRSTARAYTLAGQTVTAPPLAPGLYLVATPIGNLRDVSLRALEILAAADVIACEDTRVTHKLLSHYGIGTPLTPYHDHNAASTRPKLIARLAEGAMHTPWVPRNPRPIAGPAQLQEILELAA